MKSTRLAPVLLSLALLAGCDELFSPSPRPDAVRVVDTSARTGTVGDPVAPAPAVEVVDRKGKPVSGVAVTWTVSPDGGTVSATAGRTDSRGVASAGWTLPTRAGRYTLTATAEGFGPVTFVATAGPGPVAGVSLADSVRGVPMLDTIQLRASTFDRFGNPVPGAPLTWASSDTGVARVDATGLVRSLRPGRATVTASSGTGSAQARVEVSERLLSVVVGGDSVRIIPSGETGRFSAYAQTPDGRTLGQLPVAWISSDTTVLRVQADGGFRAAGPGQATVTALYGSVTGRTRTIVTSGLVQMVVHLPIGAILPGTPVALRVDAYGRNGLLPGQTVDLTSSDTTVVAVDAGTRTLRALRAGQATVTASSEGVVRRGEVTVAPSVGTLRVDPGSLRVYRGWSQPLKVVLLTPDGKPMWAGLLAWSSSAPSVAALDFRGDVAGIAPGDAEIRVSAGGRTAAVPVRVRRLQYASVTVGNVHACGTTTEGDALCWGANVYGQVGMGTANNPLFSNDFIIHAPTLVVDGRFPSVAAGQDFTCGVDAAGAEHCWGAGYGPLRCDETSRGLYRTRCTGVPLRVSAGPFASLAAGGFGVCGMRADGTVTSCRGAVGTPTSDLRQVSMGETHACALNPAGVAYCWGSGAAGETGGDPGAGTSAPRRVGEGLEFRSVEAGSRFTCGVTTADEAYCWGSNRYGQLGGGAADTLAHPVPTRVAGGLAFASLAVGASHACGITRAGEAYCWGSHQEMALGTGTPAAPDSCGSTGTRCSTRPLPVSGGLRWRTLAAGGNATCGIATDDALYCWGSGVSFYQSSPTPVPTRMARQL